MRALLSPKTFTVAIVVAAVSAGTYVLHYAGHQHDQRMASSCANHAIQLKFLVTSFLEGTNAFPAANDARGAFVKMGRADAWIASVASSCPEAFERDGSIGYRFVADGLDTTTAIDRSALIFFCPADSHQGSDQHCHALFAGGLRCITSNAEMMDVLRGELSRAKSGALPYSSAAQGLMEREISLRTAHAREREPNKEAE